MKTMNRDGCRFHCFQIFLARSALLWQYHDFIVSIETVDTGDQYSSSIPDMQETIDWCSP